MPAATLSLRESIANSVPPGGFFTATEVAGYLKQSRSFVYAEMAAGRLLYVKNGRSRRVPREALIDYAENLLVQNGVSTEASK